MWETGPVAGSGVSSAELSVTVLSVTAGCDVQ
jgi:hypothetical protein